MTRVCRKLWMRPRSIREAHAIRSGCVAAALAVLFATLGVVVFGHEMLPNLLAELSGVSLELAIVVLVIERVASNQRRRDARFAYEALSVAWR